MAENKTLTQRLRNALAGIENVEEKKMFRGISFMVNGKMCFSTGDTRLMCRIDPDIYDEILLTRNCEPMLMKGKVYKGWIYVDEHYLKTKKAFDFWCKLALDFNKKLQATGKKRK